jgi:hypothetical protein
VATGVVAATEKSGASPTKTCATRIAVDEAPRAASVSRPPNRRCSSSSTNTAPAIGALNAAASPAPVPAAMSERMSGQRRRKRLPMSRAPTAPICTLGPSGPTAMPPPIASSPPTNLTRSSLGSGIDGSSCCNATSTSGIPLPSAYGENRRANQVASTTAPAHAQTTAANPIPDQRWHAARNASRSRSAPVSPNRKIATTSPVQAPTTIESSPSDSAPSRSRSVRAVRSASLEHLCAIRSSVPWSRRSRSVHIERVAMSKRRMNNANDTRERECRSTNLHPSAFTGH